MIRALVILFALFNLVEYSSARDSLSLEKYYPKPKITAIEILIGPSSSTIRGVDSSISSLRSGVYHNNTVRNKVGYSFGVEFIHNFSRHVGLHARFLWERKGVEEKTIQ
jgi:hypothetical protein